MTERAADWLSAGDALTAILRAVEPLGTEERPLLDSRGFVLAADIVADVRLPPWDNSAMDGFAVRAQDVSGASTANPVTLRVVDDVPAGGVPRAAVGAGETARVMTGAPIPRGCDSVVRVEHTDGGVALGSAEARVEVRSDADAGRNVRRAGEDVQPGEVPLRAGDLVTPARVAVAAALGHGRLRVVRRPVVGVLASGDELVPVEQFEEVRAGRRIVSSNAYALAAQLAEIGCTPRLLGIARDTPQSLREHLRAAEGCDALVSTAGVSVGEHDHLRRVLAGMQTELVFWRVRARPGSALAFGRVGDLGGIPWFGLPGNPVSTLVTFELFARPALLRMAGHTRVHAPTREVTLLDAHPPTGSSTHFSRVRLRPGDGDAWTARLTRSQGSGVATGMAEADALAVIPPGAALPPGATVTAVVLGGAPPVADPPF